MPWVESTWPTDVHAVSAPPDPRFMERAAALALAAVQEGSGGPFGAVVVRAGQIVGEGQNRVLELCDPTAHAEMLAIRDACRRQGRVHLDDCELYASCEPCPMCLASGLWAHVGRIWYSATREDAARVGFDDARFHAEFARPTAQRALKVARFLPGASERALEAWARDEECEGY